MSKAQRIRMAKTGCSTLHRPPVPGTRRLTFLQGNRPAPGFANSAAAGTLLGTSPPSNQIYRFYFRPAPCSIAVEP
jgi:hypothetical protein